MDDKMILEKLKEVKSTVNSLISYLEMKEMGLIEDKDTEAKKTIVDFINKNGTLLDKTLQQELYKLVSKNNHHGLSLVKLLRYLNISYSYVKSDKEWKDIEVDHGSL